jgi:phosphocarrier protein
MMNETLKVGSVSRAQSSAVLTHEGGLHARPAIKLTQLAKCFDSNVWIALAKDGPWTDAKSIARVMAMKTPFMATLYFAAEGGDAAEAAGALAKLVESDFTDLQNNGQ